jgi:hypothetical protein
VPGADTLRAARKLSRALRALDATALAAAEARVLRRALTRAARGIAQALATLDGAVGKEPNVINVGRERTADAPALRVALAASAGATRAPGTGWTEDPASERFRRSS